MTTTTTWTTRTILFKTVHVNVCVILDQEQATLILECRYTSGFPSYLADSNSSGRIEKQRDSGTPRLGLPTPDIDEPKFNA